MNRKKKKYSAIWLCTSIVWMLFTTAQAQYNLPENRIWKFGDGAGYDFNTNTAITSQLNSVESSNAVCDNNGQLLFYTEGYKIWDRNNNPMPGANPLFPGAGGNAIASTAQGALIVADPANSSRYYLFSLTAMVWQNPRGGQLYYSVVDMTLRGGAGDVVPGQSAILLDTGLSEHMIAAPACDGVWILVHGKQQPEFKAMKLTASGIAAPVISVSGALGYAAPLPASPYNANNNYYVVGQMAAATDYRHLAAAYYHGRRVELHDFDMASGVVSNSRVIDTLDDVYSFYGVCFSPDNSRLYAARCAATPSLKGFFQYDLTLPTVPQIRNSRQYLGPCNATLTQMQLGPDGRIYFNGNYTSRMGVIQNPNALGVACGLDLQGITLISGTNAQAGFHNTFVKPVPVLPDSLGISWNDTAICAGDTVTLQPIGNYPGVTFRWNTGDTTPAIRTSAAGTYWLEMNANSNYYCPLRDTVTVGVIYPPVPDLGPDRGVCDKDLPVILSAPQLSGTTYLWSTGQSGDQISVLNSGTFWVEVTHMGCRLSDTVAITVVPTPVVYIGPDTAICAQYPLVLSAGSFPGATYLWSTGAATPSASVSTTGTYVLTVNLEGCIVHDTVQVTAMPSPDVDLGEDRDICSDQELILSDGNANGNKYLWSTGDTTAAIAVRTGGMYSLRVVTEYGCEGNDTVLLSYYAKPEVFIGPDTTVCEETPLLLTPWTLNADSLIWSDGNGSASLLVRYGGTYIVTVQNKCGTASDTIEIDQIFCDLWLPNAFTPDGDGVNDVFRILGNIGKMQGVAFSIFNRWGERTFYTADKYAGWDGLFKGVPAQLGTYVYLLQYEMDNKPYIRKGNFHLLR